MPSHMVLQQIMEKVQLSAVTTATAEEERNKLYRWEDNWMAVKLSSGIGIESSVVLKEMSERGYREAKLSPFHVPPPVVPPELSPPTLTPLEWLRSQVAEVCNLAYA